MILFYIINSVYSLAPFKNIIKYLKEKINLKEIKDKVRNNKIENFFFTLSGL
jgi:hypothetical protein